MKQSGYFKSTIRKAVSQVQGAERKLFDKKNHIYIRHPELGGIKFNPLLYKNIQRVIINLNDTPLFYQAGELTLKNNFVHIFNWNAFLNMVNELDTIPDLIKYLQEREVAFKNNNVLIMNGSEEDWGEDTIKSFSKYTSKFNPVEKKYILISGSEIDLVADYLINDRVFNKNFLSNEYNGLSIKLDGRWSEYIQYEKVKRKKEADKVSYFVDELVRNEFQDAKKRKDIRLAAQLLSLSRFERRIFGEHFFEFWQKYRHENGYFIARRYGKINDIVFIFLLHGFEMKEEIVDISMEIAVKGYCYLDKYKSKQIVLVANSNKLNRFKFIHFSELKPFSEKEEQDILHDLKVLNWFKKIETIRFNIKEYPDI